VSSFTQIKLITETNDPSSVPLEAEWMTPLIDQGKQWVQARNSHLLEAPGDTSLAAFFIGINDVMNVISWKNVSTNIIFVTIVNRL
jgi:hypothetical protein